MGYRGMSRRRSVAVWLVLMVVTSACATGGSTSDDGVATKPGKGTSSEVSMPSGTYTGNWPDDPAAVANNPRATGSFELITVEVSGDNWTIETGYSTTVPVGGPCSSTGTSSISGSGTIFVDAGGPQLIGQVTQAWVRERWGDDCTPWLDEGEASASVALTYENGLLVGWINGHNVTLEGN